MNVFSAVLGAALGALQFRLTAAVIKRILLAKPDEKGKSENAKTAGAVALKAALYVAAAALLLTVFRAYLIPVGIGFGVGMMLFAAINMITESKRK